MQSRWVVANVAADGFNLMESTADHTAAVGGLRHQPRCSCTRRVWSLPQWQWTFDSDIGLTHLCESNTQRIVLISGLVTGAVNLGLVLSPGLVNQLTLNNPTL